MGCVLCPNYILSEHADASIGVTASELSLNEFGYNSVLVRNPELKDIFVRMIAEEQLLKRSMWENKGKTARRIIEKRIPEKDVMNFGVYMKFGKWQTTTKRIYRKTNQGYIGNIMGLERLYLMQTTKMKIFRNTAVKAMQKANKFLIEMI